MRDELREEGERVGRKSRQSRVDPPPSEGTGSRQDEPAPEPQEPQEAPEDEAPAEPEDPVEALERERDEYLALAQRTQADFENFRKRAAREAAVAGQRAKTGVVAGLFPVVDNLERALASAGEAEEHLAGGVRLVHSELLALLERNGVEQFDPAGERFDPTFHEALSTRPAEDGDPGVVIDVVEKGYRANGSVLRPARVVVSG
ncbi:MAG TPA: nucleotide exchange factor GrpE [Thermoleophilaceae bacterium]|nr:nucleotide exchange factor GrpE [Thermoleophilaceae bacterium]